MISGPWQLRQHSTLFLDGSHRGGQTLQPGSLPQPCFDVFGSYSACLEKEMMMVEQAYEIDTPEMM